MDVVEEFWVAFILLGIALFILGAVLAEHPVFVEAASVSLGSNFTVEFNWERSEALVLALIPLWLVMSGAFIATYSLYKLVEYERTKHGQYL